MVHRGLTYVEVGVTDPASDIWRPGAHRFETTLAVGEGEACWSTCRADLLGWAVKTRSGFDIGGGPTQVQVGQEYELIFRAGPLSVHEPIRVVAVVDEPNRCGFAYGTLPGHPVSGEEAFIVHRDAVGTVSFTLRSLTLPGSGWRAAAFPLFRVAQRVFRNRYLKALAC